MPLVRLGAFEAEHSDNKVEIWRKKYHETWWVRWDIGNRRDPLPKPVY